MTKIYLMTGNEENLFFVRLKSSSFLHGIVRASFSLSTCHLFFFFAMKNSLIFLGVFAATTAGIVYQPVQ